MEKSDLKSELLQMLPNIADYMRNPTLCPCCRSSNITLSSARMDRVYGTCHQCETVWLELERDGRLYWVKIVKDPKK